MAEVAKILSPHKKVILPDINAGCSLEESCQVNEFREFKKKYPNHVICGYDKIHKFEDPFSLNLPKVVVNSRTGTVVIGGEVRISPAAVAHGSLSVRVKEDTKLLSEGTGTVVGDSATVAGTAATTAADTEIEVDQDPARAFVFDPGIELQTLVDALYETGTTATDMVAILEALREAGSLRAELIIK